MKKSFIVIFSLISAILLAGCQPKQLELSDLAGSWYNAKDNFTEEWTSSGDTHLKGKAYEISEGDTAVFETLEIKEVNGVLTYLADIEDVMGQGITAFPLTNRTAATIEFTNKEHDYPQVLLYEKQGADSLKVTIGKFPLKDDKEPVVFQFVKKK